MAYDDCLFLEAMYAELSAPLPAMECIVTAGTALSGNPYMCPLLSKFCFSVFSFPCIAGNDRRCGTLCFQDEIQSVVTDHCHNTSHCMKKAIK